MYIYIIKHYGCNFLDDNPLPGETGEDFQEEDFQEEV